MSLLTFLLSMVIAGSAVGVATYGAAMLGKFTFSALLYHAIIASIMIPVYYYFPGGFENHFNRPDPKAPVTLTECGYYSLMTHATVGYGDIYPKTRPARLMVCLHVLLSFLGISLLIPMSKTVFDPSSFVNGG